MKDQLIKSDVSDAIHIRTLHQLGLLPPVFITDEFATTIRPLVRMRQSLIEDGADYIRRIQKTLRLINVRLDATLTDRTGGPVHFRIGSGDHL